MPPASAKRLGQFSPLEQRRPTLGRNRSQHSLLDGGHKRLRDVSSRETARLVAEAAGITNWDLVYQSRSGPPTQPWLEPDILDHLKDLHAQGVRNIVLAPLGFTSDHMEVLYDLDTEARELAEKLGHETGASRYCGYASCLHQRHP